MLDDYLSSLINRMICSCLAKEKSHQCYLYPTSRKSSQFTSLHQSTQVFSIVNTVPKILYFKFVYLEKNK